MGTLGTWWARFLRVSGCAIALAMLWVWFPWMLVSVPAGEPRLLLVGDPQMMRSDGSLHGELNKNFNDLYQRFVLWRALAATQPTHVVVLGDIFEYQFLEDAAWDAIVRRWRWIVSDVAVPLVLLAGNHDIGYGAEQSNTRNARWERDMGALNGELRLSAHWTLVWCNAMVLDGGVDPNWGAAAWQHLRRERAGNVVLATHIPLWKPRGTCLGDEPEIRKAHGFVLDQTMLSADTTQALLALPGLRYIVNGHDHVGCYYEHPTPSGALVPEHTIQAIQAMHWGYTALLVPGVGLAGTQVLHNTPFIVVFVAVPVWIALFAITWCVRRIVASFAKGKKAL